LDSMDKIKVNFNCPVPTVAIIDEMAKNDHRDRTSMLNIMIDYYLFHSPGRGRDITETAEASNGIKRTTKKKAGAR
jgi:hypothetical protein